jgi:predicted heme/steroid binding protein
MRTGSCHRLAGVADVAVAVAGNDLQMFHTRALNWGTSQCARNHNRSSRPHGMTVVRAVATVGGLRTSRWARNQDDSCRPHGMTVVRAVAIVGGLRTSQWARNQDDSCRPHGMTVT